MRLPMPTAAGSLRVEGIWPEAISPQTCHFDRSEAEWRNLLFDLLGRQNSRFLHYAGR